MGAIAFAAILFCAIGYFVRYEKPIVTVNATISGVEFMCNGHRLGAAPNHINLSDLKNLNPGVEIPQPVTGDNWTIHYAGAVLGSREGPVIWGRIPSGLRSKYHVCETPWGDGLASFGEVYDKHADGRPAVLMLHAKPRRPQSLVQNWTIATTDQQYWTIDAEISVAQALRFGILDSREVFVRVSRFSSSALVFDEVPVSSVSVLKGSESTSMRGTFPAPKESGDWLVALLFKVPQNSRDATSGTFVMGEDVLCRKVP
jgi:hypothetical protein